MGKMCLTCLYVRIVLESKEIRAFETIRNRWPKKTIKRIRNGSGACCRHSIPSRKFLKYETTGVRRFLLLTVWVDPHCSRATAEECPPLKTTLPAVTRCSLVAIITIDWWEYSFVFFQELGVFERGNRRYACGIILVMLRKDTHEERTS